MKYLKNEDVIHMSDKEKPMKPNRYWFNRNLYKCGACRKTLDIIEHNYCPQCGQLIDWSVYEDDKEATVVMNEIAI